MTPSIRHGISSETARMALLTALCDKIFPASLSALYRADQYVRAVGEDLLRIQLPDSSAEKRQRIIEHLITGYADHAHSFTHPDLRELGLNARAATEAEESVLAETWDACREFLSDESHALSAGPTALLCSRSLFATYQMRSIVVRSRTSGEVRTVTPDQVAIPGAGAWQIHPQTTDSPSEAPLGTSALDETAP